ncbi:MAG: sigma-70 family RNA polymerase sigma factor [Planctomycetota bacterium]|nr:sigma-70 family RNA polymerase sigma factor [Planctomycetota bacterium]
MSTTAVQTLLMSAEQHASNELPEAYGKLIERYRSVLINQALAIVGKLEDAEDVVQETFCEAFRGMDRLAEVRSVSAWLRTINRRNALNRLRDRGTLKRNESRRLIEAPQRFATTGGIGKVEVQEYIAKAIERLPEKQRHVIIMRFWEHLSTQEIAARQGLSPRMVQWLVGDAMERLHRMLGETLSLGAQDADSAETPRE